MGLSVFGFIETFFFLSLAVSFVLILLLVYHFKQRISFVEKKTETVIRVINDVVMELNTMKQMCSCMGGGFTGCFMGGASLSTGEPYMNREERVVEECPEEIVLQLDDDDDGDDDDDDDEDDDDDDEDDEDGTEHPPQDTEFETKIVVSDTEEPASSQEATETDYRKMTLPALKQLVVARGLVADVSAASKMKKPDLLHLLKVET